jgi:hypothetical protein
MSDVLLIASFMVVAGVVGVTLVRSLAARRVQARQDRLKEHLDWVNPVPQTSRRRTVARR